jgi:hypothetical protein
MARFAVVAAGVVANLVDIEGGAAWAPPEGSQIVQADGVKCAIGWTYDGQAFVDPTPPVVLDVSATRVLRLAALESALNAALDAGMTYQGKKIQMRAGDRGAVGDSVLAAKDALENSLPFMGGHQFAWRCADDSFLPLDAAGVIALGRASSVWYYGVLVKYWTAKDTLLAADGVQAVGAVDVSLSGS